jgi:hypothetical protein
MVGALEDTVALLRLAASNLDLIDRSPGAIQREIQLLTNEIVLLQGRAALHIDQRAKPKLSSWEARRLAPRFHVYVDECGSRGRSIQPKSYVFALPAVIIEEDYYWDIARPRIQDLKLKHWPEIEGRVVLHEPVMRQHKEHFSFHGDLEKQRAFDADYRALLQELDFRCVAAVVDKGSLLRSQNDATDAYLPKSIYGIAHMLLVEQVCALLKHECRDAVGSIFPESITDHHDVELQSEHARIFMKGTLRISGRWLQHQIRPGLRFFRKGDAEGNELADTVARTVADHANGEGPSAILWDCIAPKLYRYTDFQNGAYAVGEYARFPAPRLHAAA